MKRPSWVVLVLVIVLGMIGCASSQTPVEHSENTSERLPQGKGMELHLLEYTYRYIDVNRVLAIKGRVRNDSKELLQSFRILATVYGPNEKLIGNAETFLQPTMIGPGDVATFDFFLQTKKDPGCLVMKYWFDSRL